MFNVSCLLAGMCVCLYSFTVKVFWTYLRAYGSTICVESVIPSDSAKFLHLLFQKCHISSPKTKLQQLANWRENDILAREKMIYVDIGYKLASIQN